MSSRRTLTPGERARQDRNLAEARDAAASHPGALVMATMHAEHGEPCSWCDCPPDDLNHQQGVTCAGCPADADLVVVIFLAGTQDQYPICGPHWPKFMADAAALFGMTDLEVIPRPIYDEEQTRG